MKNISTSKVVTICIVAVIIVVAARFLLDSAEYRYEIVTSRMRAAPLGYAISSLIVRSNSLRTRFDVSIKENTINIDQVKLLGESLKSIIDEMCTTDIGDTKNHQRLNGNHYEIYLKIRSGDQRWNFSRSQKGDTDTYIWYEI